MPIYDLSYQHYEGARQLRQQWWTIARNTAQATLKRPASGRYLFFIFITFLGFAFIVYLWRSATQTIDAILEVNPTTQALEIRLGAHKFPIAIIFFRYLSILFWPLLLYVITSVSVAISAEVQGGGLTVIMARPLRRRHYVIGKILGLAGLPTLAAGLVMCGAFMLLWGYYFTFPQALRHSPVLICALFHLGLAGILCGLSALALHPHTSTFRRATGGFFFYWFGTWLFSTVSTTPSLRTVVSLLSPTHILDGIYLWLSGVRAPQGVDSRFLRDLMNGEVRPSLLVLALLAHFIVLGWRTRSFFVGVR
ncbi:MAG: ABC transporter permease subunit [Candidatus Sumerlaeaceae bacterium]|jgi:ABC-type transport system involved in multi-copper enzyme maturation permease subunit